MAMLDSMVIMFRVAMMMTIIENLILFSSIDVGGGDHFGGADPDATPLDDGEVTISTIATIIIIIVIAIINVAISYHGQTLIIVVPGHHFKMQKIFQRVSFSQHIVRCITTLTSSYLCSHFTL